MKSILVCGVGGPTPRSFVRAVKWFGGKEAEKYRFVGMDANPLAYGLYDKDLFDASYVIPRASEAGYWDMINKIVASENIDAAIVLPELEVMEWARNADNLVKPIKTHLPDYNLATELVNKHKLHSHLRGTEYIPKFVVLDPTSFSYEDVRDILGDFFWIRSTEGSSGLGSLKVTSEDTLKQWVSINPNITEFIATEYLSGRNMACKLLYFDNKLVSTACAERVNYIMAKVAPSGITGNTSFGRLLNEPKLVGISIDTLSHFSKTLNCQLNGVFTVDFKEDAAGAPKITEINIRHVAFTSSIAAGGANLPLDTLEALFSNYKNNLSLTHYQFEEGMIFIRDVDGYPIVMKEAELIKLGM